MSGLDVVVLGFVTTSLVASGLNVVVLGYLITVLLVFCSGFEVVVLE